MPCNNFLVFYVRKPGNNTKLFPHNWPHEPKILELHPEQKALIASGFSDRQEVIECSTGASD
jgi:hypothetical protein